MNVQQRTRGSRQVSVVDSNASNWSRWLGVACLLVALASGRFGVAQSPPARETSPQLTGASELPKLPVTTPEAIGLDPRPLQQIEGLVRVAIESGQTPGAVVLIGHQGHIVYQQAFGQRQLEPQREPMTLDTVFDLASLTKPIATATSIMQLVEAGELRLRDRVGNVYPGFAANGKAAITIEQLLLHQGGLIPDNALADYQQGPEEAWARIKALTPISEPGTRFAYTDVGFLVLAEVVRELTEKDIDAFTQAQIFQPLGMHDTGYLPAEELTKRAAATEQRDGEWLKGVVHDPRAAALGGVAGHAGLFSTASDLAIYCQMLLNRGEYHGHRILQPQTVRTMTAAHPVSRGTRGFGWDKQSPYSSNRGELMTDSAFGHGGFTGTSLWIDPQLDLFVIFLSTRLHPDGRGSVNSLAGRIGTLAASAVLETRAPDASLSPPVLSGLDVLAREDFRRLAGLKIGLITNHTGLTLEGEPNYVRMAASHQVDLRALFSPEHGFTGTLDVARIKDSQESATGLPIYSLYGETRRPTPQMLTGLDALVFDIQDIGTRYYTYLSTMGEAMLAAAAADVKFIVLDRPNPLNGITIRGPLLAAGQESFVGFHPIPVQHGMTLGELAELIRAERNIDVELDIIPCQGWRRGEAFDATGRMWINPSPNMRSLKQAFLYPAVGLLETTNLSVGRGTDTPFEWFGAPWIDGRRLAAELNAAGLTGIRFVPVTFTPRSSKFAGEQCEGVYLEMVERRRFEADRVGLTLAVTLRRLYPEPWELDGYRRLLANDSVWQQIAEGASVETILAEQAPLLDEFRERREPHLLYR